MFAILRFGELVDSIIELWQSLCHVIRALFDFGKGYWEIVIEYEWNMGVVYFGSVVIVALSCYAISYKYCNEMNDMITRISTWFFEDENEEYKRKKIIPKRDDMDWK